MGTPKASGKFRFPLWLHPSGQWCKKHRGTFHYFGTDKDEALKRYVVEWDDRKAGRPPRAAPGGLTVGDLSNRFLTAKRDRVDTGELTERSWADYHRTCEVVVTVLGRNRHVDTLRADDFARLHKVQAKRFGPTAMGNFVQRVRTVFKYAFEAELVPVPVRFGPDFAKPPRRVLRLRRADRAPRLIPADDLRKLIAAAGPPLEAMILLGINCGFGQTDCSELPRAAIARPGWVDFRRPKTGSPRRAPLWPETVKALVVATAVRPTPLDPDDHALVFVTRFGRPFVRFTKSKGNKPGHRIDGIGQEFNKLVRRLKLDVPGGFYTLRHTFRTVADEVLDPVAVGLVMGHTDDTIAGAYRERVGDARLRRVTDHVRNWVFAEEHAA